jgi:hypothetical protein
LGEAYSVLVDNAEALAWNPAALNKVKKRSFSFMHAAHAESAVHDYAGYAQNLDAYETDGAFGFGVAYFSAGDISRRDTTGRETGTLTPYDIAFLAGYALQYNSVTFGLSWKNIRSQLEDTAQARALDVGVLSPRLWGERLQAGFTVANFGGRYNFDKEFERLPLTARAGAALELERWSAEVDGIFPRDNDPYGALGVEYLVPVKDQGRLAFRAGINSLTKGDLPGTTGLSLGMGFGFPKFSLDYGIVPMGRVDLMHRVSMSLDF